MTGPRQSRRLGHVYRVLAVVGAILAYGLVVVFTSGDDDMQKLGFAAGLVVGMALWTRGARHLQPLAETVLDRDGRRPILYLRSFLNERNVLNEERGFADLFAPAGPFVAIGQPGERLPPLGAARLYVEDDKWQDRVIDLLGRARLVLVYGGRTPGLGWELAQLRRRLSPQQLIVMVPNDPEAWQVFRDRAAQAARLDLPKMPGKADLRHATLGVAGFLSFGSDWSPRFSPLKAETTRATGGLLDGSASAAQSAMALADILDRIGVPCARPERSGLLVYAKVARIYFALLFLAIALGGAVLFFLWSQGIVGIDDQRGPYWIR